MTAAVDAWSSGCVMWTAILVAVVVIAIDAACTPKKRR